jgi:peptide/nickel transport system permease protein
VVARVLVAWLVTYVLASALAELGREPLAERAARVGARLPLDDAHAPLVRSAIIDATAREFGLGGSAASRVLAAVRRAATFDWGTSWRVGRPVSDVIGPGLAATGVRGLIGFSLAVLLGAALGLTAAYRGGWRGAVLGSAMAAGLAIPTLWLCQLGLAALTPGPWGARLLATVALAVAPAAVIAIHMRSAVDEFLGSALAVALAARGISPARLVWVHGARLTLAGVAPLAASCAGFVLGASIVVERALAVPGAGRILAEAAAMGDAPVISVLAALTAATVAAISGIAEVVAMALDPRQREMM